MNAVFKLMIYSMMLNFAVGIMITAIPAFELDPSTRGGLNYNESFATEFTTSMERNITPESTLEDAGNAIYRILDMLNIGFIARFINIVDAYMFGFVNVISAVFGGYMSEALRSMIFGSIKLIITIGYVLGAFRLWTGKDLND
jgi:hypothetical protein